MGSLPHDSILYTIGDGTFTFLKSIKSDGSNDTSLASFAVATTKAVAPNPTKTNQYAFASIDQNTSQMTLYLGNSALSTSSATLLTSTSFVDIDDIQFTPDGTYIIFKADSGLGYKMYRIPVTGGNEVSLDDVFEFSVSPVNGSHLIAYSKPLATTSEVYTIDYTTATQTPITSLGADVFYPTWSRDGSTILFGYLAPSAVNADLYKVSSSGGTATQVTNSSNVYEIMGFFNEDMTKIASVGFDASNNLNLSVMGADGSNVNSILSDNSLGVTCYWTDSNGRAIAVNLPHFQIGPRKRRAH
ncbi:MAG: PD40 domain-containing protein [Armatimonadetes bacterium]|nr:PD40 domain-containing protein [Armatimonadota bacterium]MBS1725953.1 PD40 domain-containing protein [Armatimonadota bacterium]